MGRCKANGHHAVESKVHESEKHEQQIEEKFACNREIYSCQCISILCDKKGTSKLADLKYTATDYAKRYTEKVSSAMFQWFRDICEEI